MLFERELTRDGEEGLFVWLLSAKNFGALRSASRSLSRISCVSSFVNSCNLQTLLFLMDCTDTPVVNIIFFSSNLGLA